MREDTFVPGFRFISRRGKIIDYKSTVNIPPIGFRDPSKFGLLELEKESLDELVSRLEIQAKEAIKRRIDSVYLDYLFRHNPYDIRLQYTGNLTEEHPGTHEEYFKQFNIIFMETFDAEKDILPPYQEADLKLNTKALEGIKFDVEKWKKLMVEHPLQIVPSYVDVVTIESDGHRYIQSLTRDVWDFIKMSAEVEYKNGQHYYKINNKIYTNE